MKGSKRHEILRHTSLHAATAAPVNELYAIMLWTMVIIGAKTRPVHLAKELNWHTVSEKMNKELQSNDFKKESLETNLLAEDFLHNHPPRPTHVCYSGLVAFQKEGQINNNVN